MKSRILPVNAAAVLLLAIAAQSGEPAKPANPTKPKLAVSIKPQHLTDALRTVIMADREVYTRVWSEHAAGSPSEPGKSLPSPCELLHRGSQTSADKGVEFSYVLRSLTPVNPRNAPETDAETKGLQFVSARPDLVYSTEELLGGRWYYTAVYPDTAVNQSCVSCHSRQRSASLDLKIGKVLGGLVVRIALEL